MCNHRSYFVSYRAVHRPTRIQGAEGVLSTIGIGIVPLTVETRSEKKTEILLLGVLHISGLFTNLVSNSELLRKGYYLHCDDQTVNLCGNNVEFASCPLQDRLFVLKLYKGPQRSDNRPLIPPANAATSQSVSLVEIWHRRLGHPSYLNLKRFGNVRGIDLSKLKLEKDLFFCRIYS